MPYFEIHNHNVNYLEIGEGIPIILGHSSASTAGQWKALMTGMSNSHRSIAPDHVGYGKTDVYKGSPDLITLEVDILTHLLDQTDQPVHLIGHSYGGSLVSRLALRFPDQVKSLTLVEPTFFHLLALYDNREGYEEIKTVAERAKTLGEQGDFRAAAQGFIDYWVGPGGFERMKDKIQQFVIAAMPKVGLEFDAIFYPEDNLEETLPELTCPKLLIQGEHTTQAARGVVNILASYWSDASIWECAEGGHMCPVSHPQQVNARISAFISDVDGLT